MGTYYKLLTTFLLCFSFYSCLSTKSVKVGFLDEADLSYKYLYARDQDGDNVVFRMKWPTNPVNSRYYNANKNEGLTPVVITVQGGLWEGTLPLPSINYPHILEGAIGIDFMFAGGSSTINGIDYSSDGFYDYRGPKSKKSLLAISLFAIGKTEACDQKWQGGNCPGTAINIEDWVGYKVETNNVGYATISNGSNIGSITLARYGQLLHSSKNNKIAWYVSWEGPFGGGHIIALDLNKAINVYEEHSCTIETCEYGLSSTNTYFESSNSACPEGIWTRYIFPPSGPQLIAGVAFIDINNDGEFTWEDTNKDCVFDGVAFGPENKEQTDDIYFVAFEAPNGKLAYTTDVTKAFTNNPLSDPVPSKILDLHETVDYWKERSAASYVQDHSGKVYLDKATENLNDLMVIITANGIDHVQIVGDHPHVKLQYDEWKRALTDSATTSTPAPWVRLNPDKVYADYLSTGNPKCKNVDVDANADISWGRYHANDPNTVLQIDCPEINSQDAAILELMDRVHYNDRSPNLSSMLQ